MKITQKNHTASSVMQVSRNASPIKELGWGEKVDYWFNLFKHWSVSKPKPAMFQSWPFRYNINNKNKIQNKKKTKMVQKRVQGNFILFLLCIRKSIKNMHNRKNLQIVVWKKQDRQRIYRCQKLANVRRDVLHKKRLMEVEINKIKEVKAIISKIKNNIEKREEYREKNTIEI